MVPRYRFHGSYEIEVVAQETVVFKGLSAARVISKEQINNWITDGVIRVQASHEKIWTRRDQVRLR